MSTQCTLGQNISKCALSNNLRNPVSCYVYIQYTLIFCPVCLDLSRWASEQESNLHQSWSSLFSSSHNRWNQSGTTCKDNDDDGDDEREDEDDHDDHDNDDKDHLVVGVVAIITGQLFSRLYPPHLVFCFRAKNCQLHTTLIQYLCFVTTRKKSFPDIPCHQYEIREGIKNSNKPWSRSWLGFTWN